MTSVQTLGLEQQHIDYLSKELSKIEQQDINYPAFTLEQVYAIMLTDKVIFKNCIATAESYPYSVLDIERFENYYNMGFNKLFADLASFIGHISAAGLSFSELEQLVRDLKLEH